MLADKQTNSIAEARKSHNLQSSPPGQNLSDIIILISPTLFVKAKAHLKELCHSIFIHFSDLTNYFHIEGNLKIIVS